jgi:hypothetical protein
LGNSGVFIAFGLKVLFPKVVDQYMKAESLRVSSISHAAFIDPEDDSIQKKDP